MSLDETSLSNGDVYTILTNKAAHGGKRAVAAMICGVATDVVSAVLRKIPLRQRLKVKTVTTDLSSAMMLKVRKVFPGASLINDRFHGSDSSPKLSTNCVYATAGKCLMPKTKPLGNTVKDARPQKQKQNGSLSDNESP